MKRTVIGDLVSDRNTLDKTEELVTTSTTNLKIKVYGRLEVILTSLVENGQRGCYGEMGRDLEGQR